MEDKNPSGGVFGGWMICWVFVIVGSYIFCLGNMVGIFSV